MTNPNLAQEFADDLRPQTQNANTARPPTQQFTKELKKVLSPEPAVRLANGMLAPPPPPKPGEKPGSGSGSVQEPRVQPFKPARPTEPAMRPQETPKAPVATLSNRPPAPVMPEGGSMLDRARGYYDYGSPDDVLDLIGRKETLLEKKPDGYKEAIRTIDAQLQQTGTHEQKLIKRHEEIRRAPPTEAQLKILQDMQTQLRADIKLFQDRVEAFTKKWLPSAANKRAASRDTAQLQFLQREDVRLAQTLQIARDRRRTSN